MAKLLSKRILIDGREFVAGRRTGIGRFLEGLLVAIADKHPEWKPTVVMDNKDALPALLLGKVKVQLAPRYVEWFWPQLASGFDLFLSPYPKLPVRKLPCPSIHTVHDVFYLTHAVYREDKIRIWLAGWLLKRSVAKASLTWFVSQASQDACDLLLGPAPKAAVRYSPIEPLFSPANTNQNNGLENFFLCVGNGLPHKNVEVLLKAIQGTGLQLKCVGIGEEARDRLCSEFPDLNEGVHFLNQVDDETLVQLYRGARALLLSSTEEGYGFPPLEAFACGTPAIVSDIPVLRGTTGGLATYCAVHDVKAWQEAMLMMLQSEVRENLSVPALAWVKQRQGLLGWDKHINDLEDLMVTK